MVNDVLNDLIPVSLVEKPQSSAKPGIPGSYELACNLACARSCNARYASCYDRTCRDQRSACVRACGC